MEQASKVTLTSRAFRNDQLPLLCQELHELTGYDMALPMNSGAEAVETAIKAARKWGYTVKGIPDGQAEIIVCANNFHGRTVTIVGFSTDEQYRDGFGPFTPGFKVIPYGDAKAVRDAITPNTCAFLVEPIQGEAGIVIPPDGFLRQAAAICRKNHVLLEDGRNPVRSGPHRQAVRFQHEGVRPDVVIIGKALSAASIRSPRCSLEDVLGVFHPGDHGSTFGGNPLACAVARAAIRVLVDEKMIENSERARWLLPQPAAGDRAAHIWRGPRQGHVDRRRTVPGGWRAAVLRGAAEAGTALQGDARQHDPLRAAPGHHP